MNEIGILLADDEERIRKLISDFLKREGYRIFEAKNGEEALEVYQVQSSNIDLLILDVLMPEKDGWQVLQSIRETSAIPVIMLTAKSSEQDQLNGFRSGADDYITKPFSPVLLVARVQALLKRVHTAKTDATTFGSIRINNVSHIAYLNEKVLELTPKEYDLLGFLMQNKGIVLSRESILDNVWEFDYTGDLRTVDTHIKQLRYKLGEEGQSIATVRGIGYRLEVRDETIGSV